MPDTEKQYDVAETASQDEPAASATFVHRIDGDEALRAVGDSSPITIDEATNRRLRRKIDKMIMPVLCVVYGLNFLDSYASVTHMPEDIHLKGDNYQWLASLFYFGYLAVEYPASWLLQRLPLGKYSGAMVIGWGVILACFAAVSDFAGAVVIRLLLGAFEAAVSPGWTLLTSQAEQPIRVAWWVSFNGWAQILGSLVAYGIFHNETIAGYTIAPWKIIFLFTGCLTIAMGIIFLILIPDNQLNAWWLTPEDRVLAVERVRQNQQGIGNKHFKMYQLKEALLDPVTWGFGILMFAASIPNGGLSSFFALLVRSFGYTVEQTLLLGCAGGVIEVVEVLTWAYLVMYFGNRLLFALGGMVIALIGSIILVVVPSSHPGGRLAGYYISQAYVLAFVCVISLISTNIAGYTKKVTVAALFFIFYCAGNIVGPQTFRPSDAPLYIPAEIAMIVCFAVSSVVIVLLYWHLKRQNAQKAARRAAASYTKVENQEFLDLTDRENPELIYVL